MNNVFRKAGNSLNICEDKRQVLENTYQAEVNNASANEEQLCFFCSAEFFYSEGKQPIRKALKDQQKNILRFAPGIKKQREDEHDKVFCFKIFCKKIADKIQRKKEIKKEEI